MSRRTVRWIVLLLTALLLTVLFTRSEMSEAGPGSEPDPSAAGKQDTGKRLEGPA